MARYQRSYAGERRTELVGIWVTPTERGELGAGAAQQGASLSDFGREQLLRRAGQPPVAAGMRRNPESDAIMRALEAAAFENNAIGNLLNQIARHANTTGELRDLPELRAALALYLQVAERHLAALDRVLTL
jgi:hypothetical protein